jgi:hypothetical protein
MTGTGGIGFGRRIPAVGNPGIGQTAPCEESLGKVTGTHQCPVVKDRGSIMIAAIQPLNLVEFDIEKKCLVKIGV